MEGEQPALEQRDGRHRRSLVGALRVVAAARPRRTAIRPFAGAFERLGTDFVRVLEVAIEALTARSVIAATELPETQDKLFARKRFRERRHANAPSLFRNSDLGDAI